MLFGDIFKLIINKELPCYVCTCNVHFVSKSMLKVRKITLEQGSLNFVLDLLC